jgi:hypothetical protein
VHATILEPGECGQTARGHALRTTWDWAVRCWILSITPGMLLRSKGQDKAKLCLCDGLSKETFHHVQLSCLLSHRRALTQTAHNNVENLFEGALSQVTLLGLGQVDSHNASCGISYHCPTHAHVQTRLVVTFYSASNVIVRSSSFGYFYTIVFLIRTKLSKPPITLVPEYTVSTGYSSV